MGAAYLNAPQRAGAALDVKAIATLKARCALLGFALEVTEDDAGGPLFIITRWALTRQLRSVDEVEAFIRQAGGPRA